MKQTCKICGKEFSPRNIEQKFCSEECRKKARKIEMRRLLGRNAAKQINRPSTPKTLADWCKEAADCNLDYGNYRALIESGKTFAELKARADSQGVSGHSHHRKVAW